MAKNYMDLLAQLTVFKIFTKDEWHTAVVGFADGLSFEVQGRQMRKALTRTKIDVANIGVEKIWYYRVPYVIGEGFKVLIALEIFKRYGISLL